MENSILIMCTKDETKALNNAMELRINRRIDNMKTEFTEVIKLTMGEHTAKLDEIDKNNRTEHKLLFEKIQEVQPFVDLRKGIIGIKSIVLGASAVIIALGVIGSGFIWLVKQAIH